MQLLKESKDYENLQKEYDLIKEENQFLNCEITLAEEQIRELEKVLQMVRIAFVGWPYCQPIVGSCIFYFILFFLVDLDFFGVAEFLFSFICSVCSWTKAVDQFFLF